MQEKTNPMSFTTNPNGNVIQSPFRYPGGKGFMTNYLVDQIEQMQGVCDYAEPYAGGAGAAILLLSRGQVQRVRINDFDRRIYAAWSAMVHENDRFLETLASIRVDINEWHRAANIVKNPNLATSLFDLGFSTFFLNRTNRSGIIIGAGPIGGFQQQGNWKIDARFGRQSLIERIEWLGLNRDNIVLSNKDGLEFLRNCSKRNYAHKTLFFVDPPYVVAGSKLYFNSMTEKKHHLLGKFLQSQSLKHWLLTYDQAPLIEAIYGDSCIQNIEVVYSLQAKRKQSEFLISPQVS